MQTGHINEGEEQKRKRYSIKTVDGSRFDYTTQCPYNIFDGIRKEDIFISFKTDTGKKYFNIMNIVSITEIEVDE